MTELLQRALAEIEQLPADVQDAIATRLLAEVADEHAWDNQFQATIAAQWDRMAEKVGRSVRSGGTVPLDAVFDATLPE